MKFCPNCDCYTYKQNWKTRKSECTECGHKSGDTPKKYPDSRTTLWKDHRGPAGSN